MNNELSENEQALWILKKDGPQPLANLAKQMKVTTEGARFHLLKLEKEGLVQSRKKAEGRGRPKQIWSLTDEGNARFPDTHAELTVNLITMMRESLGDEALDKVIYSHEQKTLAAYQREMEGIVDLENRIAKLAEIRSKEGYMAEYEKDKEGFLFIENHCPICSAATICQGFCRAELNIFKKVLGEDLHIERIQHIVAGERRCAYRITKSKSLD